MTKNITHEMWEHFRAKSTKEAQKVLNALDYDILSVIQDDKVYWLEKVYSSAVIPLYVHRAIKKWTNKQGLTYLYDLPCKH